MKLQILSDIKLKLMCAGSAVILQLGMRNWQSNFKFIAFTFAQKGMNPSPQLRLR